MNRENFKYALGLVAIVVAFIFKDLIMGILMGSARKKYNESLEKDGQIRKEIDDLNRESDVLKEKANELKPGEVTEDWHLKDKK